MGWGLSVYPCFIRVGLVDLFPRRVWQRGRSNRKMINSQILITPPVSSMVGPTHIKIDIDIELLVSPAQARRRVTSYLIDHVSDHLGGDKPILVVDEKQVWWRVPVVLFLTSLGRVGQVGAIDVDSRTGDLVITEKLLEEIKAHADYLAIRATS